MKKSTNISKKGIETVALHNLGCKVNAYETQKMAQRLSEAGLRIVPFAHRADVYVVNTCSVTQIADKKSRQMLHRARRLNPNAIVVAAGCFVQAGGLTPEDVGADILLGNDKKGELLSVLEQYLEEKRAQVRVIDINAPGECYEEMFEKRRMPQDDAGRTDDVYTENAPSEPSLDARTHTRAFVKIQDGCNQFCSYCRIPYVRGRVRSRAAASILDEISDLIAKGYREIVLTGIHVSSYRDEGSGLIDLVEKIDALPGLRRLRLSSMEPRLVTEDAARRLSSCASLCPHFHLSLQSGCDETIARMNRHYTTADFAESVSYLRTYFMDPAITTDVIAGFPGETEEEFEKTLAFVRRMAFADMHVFKFSPREGTRAYAMDGQVPEDAKNARSDILLDAAQSMADDFYHIWENREVEVLFEEENFLQGKRMWTGFTREYLRVYRESEEDLKNQIVTISLQKSDYEVK